MMQTLGRLSKTLLDFNIVEPEGDIQLRLTTLENDAKLYLQDKNNKQLFARFAKAAKYISSH